MPVSPRDFELYSRMTGTSMPTDAISRARMAPEVYSFTRNFAKSPNILDKAGEMVKGIGRTFQRGIGAGIQADLSGAKSPYTNTSQRSVDRGPKPVGKTPDGQLLYDAADLKDPHRPTSGNYGQRVSENQTTESVMERKGVQDMEINTGPSTINEEIAGNQSSNPDMTSVDRDVKSRVRAVAGSVPLTTKEMLQSGDSDNMFTRNLEKTIAGDGMQEIGGEKRGKEKLREFMASGALLSVDPDLEKAMSQSGAPEALEGFKGLLSGRFGDHSQLEGGEDNVNARSQEFVKEIEGVQVNPSPNRSKDIVSERATKQMLQQIEKNKQDEERVKALNLDFDSKVTPSATSTFVNPTIKNADDFVAMVEEMKGIEASPLRSDIQVGGLQRTAKDGSKALGKSVGMSLMPGTLNGGDAVAFSFMEDPTKPDEVTTRTYSVTPETMQQLQSGEGDIGSMSFGQKMNKAIRGKEGFGSIDKSRFAGDVFITPSL